MMISIDNNQVFILIESEGSPDHLKTFPSFLGAFEHVAAKHRDVITTYFVKDHEAVVFVKGEEEVLAEIQPCSLESPHHPDFGKRS